METPAERLNRECACISVDPVALQSLLERSPATEGLYASILIKQPHLFSAVPVFVAGEHVGAIRAIVRAVETAVRAPAYVEAALSLAPPIARAQFGPHGVFYGYDFHLGEAGPQLIEINTNAGGPLLNAVLARAQAGCCEAMMRLGTGGLPVAGLADSFLAMFRNEWRLQRGDEPLRTIAIVDEAPASQYLYPEMLLFQELFRRAGLEALILAPEDLTFDGVLRCGDRTIDLVYNRLTDFYLEGDPVRSVREAYVRGAVVLTPHPHGYAVYADKRHLVPLSDRPTLQTLGLAPDVVDTLVGGVPHTVMVTPETRDALWADRKRYFFKPLNGYGGRAAYRGDKLTTRTWAEMAERAYVAQELVRPSERTIEIGGEKVPLKLDLRAYVYEGEIQLLAARLYQGQTTNFRTPGGGFAPVFTDEPQSCPGQSSAGCPCADPATKPGDAVR